MKVFYLLFALLPLILASTSVPPCVCPQVRCGGTITQQCKCINNAEIACAKKCGGTPNIQECPELDPTKVNPICGGQLNIPCPDPKQTCIPDPFREICRFVTDCTGICAGPDICGGIPPPNFCPDGKICLDNPADDCNPREGDQDCAGLCGFWQPFIPAPRPLN